MKEGLLSKEEINELLGKMDNPWGKAELIRENESKKKRVFDARIDAEDMMARIRAERRIKEDDLLDMERKITEAIYSLEHSVKFLYNREIMSRIKDGLNVSDLDRINKAVDTVLMLRKKANSEGILGLDEAAKGLDERACPMSGFIKELVLLIANATPPDVIREMTVNMGYVNGYKGADALIYFIYIYGAMLIRSDGIVWQYLVYIRTFIPMELRDQMSEYIDSVINEELERLG